MTPAPALGPTRRRDRLPGLLIPLLAACGGGDQGFEPAHDLAGLLPAAEILSEPRAIKFTAPEDRRHLRSGWSRLERDPGRGRGFAWGLGEASTIDFHLLAPRAFDLRLEGRSFKVPGAPPQAVAVAVNGTPVAEVEMRPKLETHIVPLPRERLRPGANRLELAYRWSRSPRQVSGSSDRRSLAVAWYGIGFGGGEAASPPPRPAAAGAPPRLFVPAGSELAYYLELAPGSRLRLDGWSWRGAPAGRLQIELAAEGEDPVPVTALTGSGNRSTWPLPGEETRLVRLALRALPHGPGRDAPAAADAAPAGGVELTAPAVWSPRPESAEERPQADVPTTACASGRAAGCLSAGHGFPNIVLYLIDTLRSDRLGCYGYPRPVSPRIDAFAQQAVLFERVVAQSSWTRASMASVFTGRWPPAHGTNGRRDRLRGDLEILPQRLRAAGYRTAAFVTNPNVSSTFGFDRGFDHFFYLGKEAGSDVVHQAVAEWLADRSQQTPFFLWIHTLDPHAPYDSPEAFRRRLAPGIDADAGRRSLTVLDDLQAGRRQLDATLLSQLEALYDAAVAYNDYSFGVLLDELEGHGLLDGALVILLSDHGDEFHEHGNWQHGRALHAESIGVPLIVKPPAAAGGSRVAQPVRQIDVLPTVLDLLGLPPAAGVEGRSLLPLIAGAPADPAPGMTAGEPPPAFSYLHLDGQARVSVVDRGWKLIQRFEHGELTRPRLYHVAEDPGETRELAARRPIRTGYLASLIRSKLGAGRVEAEAAELDKQTRMALEALGYI